MTSLFVRHRYIAVKIGALALLLLSGGCDTLKEQAGLTKRAPDEFTVVTKAPLVLPPDFTLRPPKPGAKRPQEVQPGERALNVVLNSANGGKADGKQVREFVRKKLATTGGTGEASDGQLSKSERSLLGKAGALEADSSIRETVNRETTLLAEKDSSFTDRLIFWQKRPPFGSTVDAGKEDQRLRETAAKGEKPNTGTVPVIRHRQRGILEGLFN